MNKNYSAWAIALFSTLTSLVFSEILKYPPCSLCWYQRIFMYSLVIILPIGILLKDQFISYYLTVFSLIGLVIALYHALIYHNVIQEVITVCTAELSCKTKQFELFGFISIPIMSVGAFLVMFFIGLKGVKDVKRA